MLIIESTKHMVPFFHSYDNEKKVTGYYNAKFGTYLKIDYELCNRFNVSLKSLIELNKALAESFKRIAIDLYDF